MSTSMAFAPDRPSREPLALARAYTRTLAALERAGVLALLPGSGATGVIGIDGGECPAPTLDQAQEVFARNSELVERKARQGFTRLLLTPIAMPISRLLDRVSAALVRHAAAETVFRTRREPSDADMPARVHAREPIWIWGRVRLALDTADVVYFPQAYAERDHQGLAKAEVMRTTTLCAVPGWSVGLIEPLPVMPRPGQGQAIGGRAQLEAHSSPREYLRALSAPAYQGETGWTPEDFLTHFLVHLETTHEVSHDRYDGNALWLLGAYLPRAMPTAHLVPVGYWASEGGRRLHLTAHRTGNRLKECVARTVVRLEG